MSDSLDKNPQVILCDMCIGEDRKPARKTCMKCEISMCVQHLQAHLTTPVLLQTHPLTAPIASGDGGVVGTTKCPQHGKVLEYYCLDDLICVCVSCAIEDQHRLHNMKTFPTAQKELLEKVTAEQQSLQLKTYGKNVSLEKWEKKEREKLGRSSVRLIKAVTNLRDLALTSVQSSVSARMVSMKTSLTSLQTAKTEEDTVRFLQMYSQVHQDLEKANAVDLRKGLEPGGDCDKLVEEIKERGEKMMEQASHFWGSLLTHVDPENHQELRALSADLCFKPQFFSPGMLLSEDDRKVFSSSQLGKGILHIQRTKSSDSSKICRWGITLSKDCDWAVGLSDQNYTKELKDRDVYGLCWIGNQLSSLKIEQLSGEQQTKRPRHDSEQRVSLQTIDPLDEDVGKQTAHPEIVEVEWSSPDVLSFYNLTSQHQRRKIVTIPITSTKQDLTPFVYVELEESSYTSVDAYGGPSLFSRTQRGQRWRCSCEKVYPWNPNSYFYRAGFGHMAQQSTCSCGEHIGVQRVTEVLCELL
ncbi:tripartite motif-containing protein 16 isoform X1 [Xyrichtys novacula]|uniref:Tripartite motif-containing protein 16 isoform X1 n=1 Tax=Xyrichtys novacula TaxID=13765 RepID=A0AAV1HMG4_XYRNO|nr:tripartite motif-containing protein 16 isoform X1 [Xyrichtys novacula]